MPIWPQRPIFRSSGIFGSGGKDKKNEIYIWQQSKIQRGGSSGDTDSAGADELPAGLQHLPVRGHRGRTVRPAGEKTGVASLLLAGGSQTIPEAGRKNHGGYAGYRI